MTGQLPLFDRAPVPDENGEVPPDTRHGWVRRSAMHHTNPDRPDEWRCDTCGELAVRSIANGEYVFLRPQLRLPPKGPFDWAKTSHLCERRDWA